MAMMLPFSRVARMLLAYWSSIAIASVYFSNKSTTISTYLSCLLTKGDDVISDDVSYELELQLDRY